MSNAITMGIFWHLIGAASAACFYAPFKKVKKCSAAIFFARKGNNKCTKLTAQVA